MKINEWTSILFTFKTFKVNNYLFFDFDAIFFPKQSIQLAFLANSPIFNVENWYYYLAMVNKVFSVHIFEYINE
uniref:Uncharacterized protein n=2 Tax=Klebsiella TaxID=570 RepID=A0A1Z3MLX3_KLEOX|nr:hypothetical protein [Klebsiella oxytoca]AXJ98597.1 hypothetical protein [Klebsiella pneumoniae]QEQ69573.1 hypothetical protein [Klebsiella pneumoniae]QEQ69900.1 hypothetical protein [Klebsiella pneumoniae]QEQ70299.1 hypothetical protein [Klebsiella pneumoniae]